MKLKALASFVLILFISNSAFGLYGARPMGMGGAYTAIANDANAAYWNPAGFAINPGVDISGSFVATNRNETIGDNIAALKMCFEAEFDPFAWIVGVSSVSLLALSGAKYLSDQGILKKNWGREEEISPDDGNVGASKKEESVSEKVLKKGTEKTEAVGQKVKEKTKEIAKAGLGAATDVARDVTKQFAKDTARAVYWGPWAYPWYRGNYYRPSYWDYGKREQGKAQFSIGLTWLTDKNSTLNQNTNFYTLSLASGYEEMVALGGNINFYDITIPSPSNLKGYGAGIDLGLIFRPIDKLSFGAVAKEILTTDVRFENGAMIRYAMSINAGVAVAPLPEITVSADIHNIFRQSGDPQTYHYGAEARPVPGLAVRAGLYDGSKTAGASIMVDPVIVDYTYLGGSFNKTQTVGVTWKM